MLNKIKATVLICVLTFTTANCRNWNIDPQYGALVNFINLVGFTSNDALDGECELILGIIQRVRNQHNRLNANDLAKQVLKVLLINSNEENRGYNFGPEQTVRIGQIKTVFLDHIHKHFSNDRGTFVDSGDGTGRHSRVLKNGGRDGLSNQEIKSILNEIIGRGTFNFSINTIPHRLIIVPRNNIGAVGAIVSGFSVYRFTGRPGTQFPDTQRENMVADLTETNFFFQLHFCRISGAANFTGDGRFGSCYVRAN